MSRRILTPCLTALVLLGLVASPGEAVPALTATTVHVTRTFRWHHPSPDPTGVSYVRSANRLVVVDSEVDETRLFEGVNAWLTTTRGRPRKSWSTEAFTMEPTDVNARSPYTFFFTDDRLHRVFRATAGRDHKWGNADDLWTTFSTARFNSRDPEGITFATFRHRAQLLICDGKDAQVYRLAPGRNGRFDGLSPTGDDVLKPSFDTASIGVPNPKGIFWDASAKLVYILGYQGGIIARTTIKGDLVDTIDISALGLVHPSGIVMAPGSDDPTAKHLYVTDKGVDNDTDPQENDGRLFEIALS
jgi:hypothetical protein